MDTNKEIDNSSVINQLESGGNVFSLKIEDIIPAVNLCEEIDDEFLAELGKTCVENYNIDRASREEWEKDSKQALKYSRMKPKERQLPYRNASNVCYPIISTASIQFSARAMPSLIRDGKLCKGKYSPTVIPQMQQNQMQQPGMEMEPQQQALMMEAMQQQAQQELLRQKSIRANRVADHISWQLLDESDDWMDGMDQLLTELPILGSGFKKTYYDFEEECTKSKYVCALNFVVDANCQSLKESSRYTEVFQLYPNQFESRVRQGIYRKIELFGDEAGENSDNYVKKEDNPEDKSNPNVYLDCYCWIDLDGDNYEEPYIVTVHESTKTVVRIKANYSSESIRYNEKNEIYCIDPIDHFTRYLFLRHPEGNFYGLGFGMLLSPGNEIINTILNQLIDAGHLTNSKPGIYDSRLEFFNSNTKLEYQIGEMLPVDFDGDDINKSVFIFPYGEPSIVLFQLLGLIIESTEKLANITDALAGETPKGNVPATTTMAMIEQGLKVYSSIYGRVHRSLKSELMKVYTFNKMYIDSEEEMIVYGDNGQYLNMSDYSETKDKDIVPVSDPQSATDMQLLARVGALMPLLGTGKVDDIEVLKEFLTSLRVDDVSRFLPKQQQQQDPQVILEMAKLELENRKHMLEVSRAATEHMKVVAEIDKIKADSIKSMAEADSKSREIEGKLQESEKRYSESENKAMEYEEELNQIKAANADYESILRLNSKILGDLMNGAQQGTQGNPAAQQQ